MLTILLFLLVIGLAMRGGVRRRGRSDPPLASFLVEAEQAGIITTEQRVRLLDHAAASAGRGMRMDGARWLGIMAGLFVLAGISLLIARNWQSVGPVARIGAYLVLLAGVGAAAIRYRDRAAAVSVTLEVLWFFLPLVGIGLYGQTFQLSGDPIAPFVLWLGLTMPMAWLSPRPFLAVVHTLTMSAVLLAGNFAFNPAWGLLVGDERSPIMLTLTHGSATLRAWLLSLAMLAAITLQSLKLLPRGSRNHFIAVVAAWLFGLMAAQTPLHVEHGGLLLLAAMSLVVLWIVAELAIRSSLEERAASLTAWLVFVYGLTFTFHFGDAVGGGAIGWGGLLAVAIVGAAIAGTVRLPGERISVEPQWARVGRAFLLGSLLLTATYLTQSEALVVLVALVWNLVLAAAAVGLMWHGSIVHDARQINMGVLVLVIVMITRFLDLFGGMLTSGVGFIVGGLLLAGVSWGLERTRRRLLAAPPPLPSAPRSSPSASSGEAS
ncbi:MAG TPA: DUF2157 domain-containing protein [Candidatus Binatia bacterium]|nr:DUF2157 domain-containing protein [Candidatus Binatia bacterium]